MQASRIGLWHLEHKRIPISARLYSGSGWTDGMMLALDRAGARHSQSPVGAEYRGGDGTSMVPGYRNRWSILLNSRKHQRGCPSPAAFQCVGPGTRCHLPSVAPEKFGKWSKLTSVKGRKCAGLTMGSQPTCEFQKETAPAPPCAGAVSFTAGCVVQDITSGAACISSSG
jgi:hypothetical protein